MASWWARPRRNAAGPGRRTPPRWPGSRRGRAPRAASARRRRVRQSFVGWLARPLHDRAALAALQVGRRAEESVEHRWKLCLDVGDPEEFLVQLVIAVLAVPLEAIELAG